MRRRISGLVFISLLLAAPPTHAEGLGKKLKGWLLGAEAQAAMINNDRGTLPDTARSCLQCHDGTRAVDVAATMPGFSRRSARFGTSESHPVGMHYDEYVTRAPRQLRPRQALNPDIVLDNGRVSCISCHRLREPLTPTSTAIERVVEQECMASPELTIEREEGDLCLACHLL